MKWSDQKNQEKHVNSKWNGVIKGKRTYEVHAICYIGNIASYFLLYQTDK